MSLEVGDEFGIPKNVKKSIKIGITSFIILMIVFGSFYIIGPGQRGVLVTLGKPSLDAKTEGIHVKIPFIQSVVKMDVKTQKYETDASAASKDLQIVSAKIAVNYHLTPESVPSLYREIGIDYNARVIQPAVQEMVKAATAKFTAEELITKREDVKDAIKIGLRDRLVTRNIIIEDISITNFDFSVSFNTAIESKVTAEQLKLKADRDLERIRVEAEQRIAAAEAEATAIRITGEALRSNPQLVQLEATKRWNGVMPLYVGGGTVPFIQIPTSQPAG